MPERLRVTTDHPDMWTCPRCGAVHTDCGRHWQHIANEHPGHELRAPADATS